MLESAVMQGAFKLILLVIGLILARLALAWLDRNIEKMPWEENKKSRFQVWFQKASSTDKAIYYAARIFAVFLAVAFVIG